MSSFDFLSYVLSFLSVDSSSIFTFEFGEPWGIQTDEIEVPTSLTVMAGHLWMLRPNSEPIELNCGDTVMLPRGTEGKIHALVSSPEVVPINVADLFRSANIERPVRGSIIERPVLLRSGGTGATTRIVSTNIGLDLRKLGPLIAALPEILIVRSTEADRVFLDGLLGNLMNANFDQPGYSALAAQTARLLLVHVVRKYVLAGQVSDVGWLSGFNDPHIARALTSIHGNPEHEWSVSSLARASGLSRSGFAERFRTRMGLTPMTYLRSWRMHLAQEALASGETTVTTLAQNLGYHSEAAFREAFRQVTGMPPREYRRQAPPLHRRNAREA